ncbi:MAG: transcriptional regulator, TetR family [Ilumatobacteraceae bacterium]|nr:transcriptional regulator, TetR family [Ilumatobacteraceae bacterium]
MRRDREDILKAAARYFSRGGFRTTSMQEVADALDVSRSSLYYHFAEKSDLLFEILMLTTEEFCTRAEAIVAYPLPAGQRFAVLFRSVLKLEIESPGVPLTLVLRDEGANLSASQREQFIAARDRYEGFFRQLVREGVERGEFRPVNTKIVTFALLGMLDEFDAWFDPAGPLSSDQIADVFSDFVLCALHVDRPPGPTSDEPAMAEAPAVRVKARSAARPKAVGQK